jgi:hypothetical protein
LNDAVEGIGTPEGWKATPLGPRCRHQDFPHTCGGTALWHGLCYTAQELKPISGHKAIVVLPDGIDAGSDITLNNLIELTESAGAVVYATKYAGSMRFVSISGAIAQAARHGLDRLSRETGGLLFPNPGRGTSEVFARIESDLRSIYVLGFTPPVSARDGLPQTQGDASGRPGSRRPDSPVARRVLGKAC